MIDLGAEAAADIRGDDAQLMLWNAQNERAHQKPDDMRVLRRGVERRFAVGRVELTDADARLHRVGHEAVVHQLQRRDVVRAFESGHRRIAVLFDKAPVIAEVIRRFLVDLGGVSADRIGHVDHCGQLFNVQINRFSRVAGLSHAVSDDSRDRIADMADLAARQNRVARLSHRLAIAGMDLPAAGQAADLSKIIAGEDVNHARHGRGRRRIHLVQIAMRNG